MSGAIVVQARMTSTRLPGKVLMDLAGRPMLERQLERLVRCVAVDDVILAVTTNPEDDPLVDLARRLGLRWYRGSEHDVLARYVGAVREARAELVVRVTADCPLIDPVETDAVAAALQQRRGTHDYASNTLERHLPRGLDSEALWADVLERVARMATSPPAREHVTWFCTSERADLFALHSVRRPFEAPDLRWTVDTADDLAMVRRLYDELALAERQLPVADVITYVRRHPELAAMNAHIVQKDAAA
ncbi:MAG TPA: glycosyltransferase family protein [Solirubrobacteraceae bacterium]|nr:glycosyltransferase family protein [Solirubrobacteraceae bacterium]